MSELDERIRRQVYRLTEQDLLDHPIWEFCSDEEGVDGQDELGICGETGLKLLLGVVNRPPFFRSSTEARPRGPRKRSSQAQGNVSSPSTRSRLSFS